MTPDTLSSVLRPCGICGLSMLEWEDFGGDCVYCMAKMGDPECLFGLPQFLVNQSLVHPKWTGEPSYLLGWVNGWLHCPYPEKRGFDGQSPNTMMYFPLVSMAGSFRYTGNYDQRWIQFSMKRDQIKELFYAPR